MEFFFFKKNIPSPEYSKHVPKISILLEIFQGNELESLTYTGKNVILHKRIVQFDLNMLCSKVYWIY